MRMHEAKQVWDMAMQNKCGKRRKLGPRLHMKRQCIVSEIESVKTDVIVF